MDGKTVIMRSLGTATYQEGTVPPDPGHDLLDPAFPYGEELLQSLWEAGLYDAAGLCTTDGRALEVLKGGRVQHHSGPDLRDALVRIDGQLLAGTVEVHLRSADWNAHGHQHDPAYNNVVLHAVHTHDGDVRTANGVVPATVELRERLDPRHIALHRELMAGEGWVPCAAHIGRVEAARIGTWLERLSIERLERRTVETIALHRRLGEDAAATFHHLLLRAMGAPVNTEAFAMLANALPLRILLKYRTDPVRTEGLIVGQAGLLPVVPLDDRTRALAEAHRVLTSLHGLMPMPAAAWKFGRMRPASFPTVRLAQLAVLVARSGPAYGELLAIPDVKGLRQALCVEADAYWTGHYRLGCPARPGIKRIGQRTADGLILNAIVPFLFAMGRIRGEPAGLDRALRLLEELPAEENAITAGWRRTGVHAGHAGRGQALIELKQKYCDERRCLACAIGSHLQRKVTDPAP